MRLDLRLNSLLIIPEHEQDMAYIRDTLGLKKESDTVKLYLRMGKQGGRDYLETVREEDEPSGG